MVLVGTGSARCRCAWRAADLLAAEGDRRVRVVSMPCWELFDEQDDDYQRRGPARRRARCWRSRRPPRSAGSAGPTTRSAIDHFGASAPGAELLDRVRVHPRERGRPGPAAARPRRRTDEDHQEDSHDRAARLYEAAGPEPLARQPQARLPHERRAAAAASTRASGASRPTRRSSRRRSAGRHDYDEQFGQLVGDARRSRTPTGSWSSTTSPTPWRCCGRCTTTAAAATASCRSRWRPAWPTTPTAPSRPPASCTSASTSPTSCVKIPATAEGVPAIQQMIAEGRNINVTLIFSLDALRRGDRGVPVRPRGAGRGRRRPRRRCTAWRRSS